MFWFLDCQKIVKNEKFEKFEKFTSVYLHQIAWVVNCQ